MSCKYCEPDEAGNLADIERDGNSLLTYLEDWGTEWVLTTELNTLCCGTDCWSKTHTHIRFCPMCGRELGIEVDA